MDHILKQLEQNRVVTLSFNKNRSRRRHAFPAHADVQFDPDGPDLDADLANLTPSKGKAASPRGLDEDSDSDEKGPPPDLFAEQDDAGATIPFFHFEMALKMENSNTEQNSNKLSATQVRSLMRLLCQALVTNYSLVSLDLGFTRIDALAAEALSRVLHTNRTLKHLKLSHNKIGMTGAQSLAKALTINPVVETLDISSNPIFNEGATALATMLMSNQTLRHLNVTKCDIYVAGSIALYRALGLNTALHTFSIARNCSWVEGARALGEALAENKSLTRLDVSSNFFYAEGTEYVMKGLAQNKGITELVYAMNEMGDDGAKYLSQALKSNRTIKTLLLHDNIISQIGAKHIGKALMKNSSVTSIHFCDNAVGAGIEWLGKALRQNSTLKHLYLAANEIKGKSVASLAKALRTNTTLLELNLAWNRLGAEGTALLAQSLRFNYALKALRIAHNKACDDGTLQLAEALEENETLESLDVSNNRIRYAGLQALARMMVKNTTITGLDLSSNRMVGLPTEIEKYLQRNIACNHKLHQIAFVMGMHSRVGENSPLFNVVAQSPIGDHRVLAMVWDFLWKREKKPRPNPKDEEIVSLGIDMTGSSYQEPSIAPRHRHHNPHHLARARNPLGIDGILNRAPYINQPEHESPLTHARPGLTPEQLAEFKLAEGEVFLPSNMHPAITVPRELDDHDQLPSVRIHQSQDKNPDASGGDEKKDASSS